MKRFVSLDTSLNQLRKDARLEGPERSRTKCQLCFRLDQLLERFEILSSELEHMACNQHWNIPFRQRSANRWFDENRRMRTAPTNFRDLNKNVHANDQNRDSFQSQYRSSFQNQTPLLLNGKCYRMYKNLDDDIKQNYETPNTDPLPPTVVKPSCPVFDDHRMKIAPKLCVFLFLVFSFFFLDSGFEPLGFPGWHKFLTIFAFYGILFLSCLNVVSF